MYKYIILFIAIILSAATADADNAVYRLHVQNFCELTVVDGVGVDYFCNPDSAGWAIFECEPELASQIMFENKSDRLTIRTAADEHPIPGIPRIKVYSASLSRVENSGDSLLRVMTMVKVPELKIKQIGNGTIELTGIETDNIDAGITAGKGHIILKGIAHKAKFSNVGTGPLDASGLKADNINCFVLGAGNIDCFPIERLRVYGAGSGKVIYHNNPEKITNRGIGIKAYLKNASDASSQHDKTPH